MPCRPTTLAAILMVSTALASLPAAAASTPGDAGDVDATWDEPVIVTGGTTPPMPAFDAKHRPVEETLNRQTLYHRYATVSHSATGETTVIPASPKLRAVIDEEFGLGPED